jgi:hypothetical protein
VTEGVAARSWHAREAPAVFVREASGSGTTFSVRPVKDHGQDGGLGLEICDCRFGRNDRVWGLRNRRSKGGISDGIDPAGAESAR